jgi:GMP synthase (glutamine-hydrolysing)
MIYLVDNTLDGQGASPRELQAALVGMQTGVEVLVEPFHLVSVQRVEELNPSHIVLSGQSHPWVAYSPQSLSGILEVIRTAPIPILGVCGGHQQIAIAYGARVDLMGRLKPGEGYEGARRERGYFPIETNGAGIFQNLPKRFTVWHSHFDEVKEVPAEFRRTAWNETCEVQAMEHTTRPVLGVQFHPELFNDEHPAGRRVLENFFAI